MMQFVKLDFKNDEAIYIDGSKPYVHWSNPVSVGLKTYMTLYWISDKSEHICKIEEGGPLYFPELNEDSWKCSSNVDWNVIQGKVFVCSSVGQEIGEEYWHHLNIILDSDVAGEFIADLYIDDECVSVGAQFFDEDESLSISLANQGLEMSNIVEKALYESDPHNESIDYVRLNNKFKELLVNFIDIHSNKGSYKSLINSLKWFGYHDLVELREVWKYHTPDGVKFYDRTLTKELTNIIKQRIFNSSKTTSLYLRNLINHFDVEKWKINKGTRALGDIDNSDLKIYPTYYDYKDEYLIGRDFNHMCTKWSLDDMKLKMVLLGAFFEKYFMSLHNDLIRSVCEDVFFTKDVTITNSNVDNVLEFCDSENSLIDSSWSSDQMTDPDYNYEGDLNGGSGLTDSIYLSLDEVYACAGMGNGIYSDIFMNQTPADRATSDMYDFIPIVGCQKIDDQNEEVNLGIFSHQYFHGIGAIATGCFKFKHPVIKSTIITDIHKTVMNNKNITITNFYEANTDDSCEIKFNILFQRPGNYTSMFEFIDLKGNRYVKILKTNVINNLVIDLDFKYLKSIANRREIQPNPWADDAEVAARYMFTRTPNIDDDGMNSKWLKYTQFIPMQNGFGELPQDSPYMVPVYNYKWVSKGDGKDDSKLITARILFDNYVIDPDFYTNLRTIDDDQTMIEVGEELACLQIICKQRDAVDPDNKILKPGIINCDESWTSSVFFPQMHELADPGYKLNCNYPIVCVPVIKVNGDEHKKFPFSYYVDAQLDGEPLWVFKSEATGQIINDLSANIQEPIIGWKYKTPIPGGMYTVSFKYNLVFLGDHGIEFNEDSIRDNTTKVTKRTNFKIVY